MTDLAAIDKSIADIEGRQPLKVLDPKFAGADAKRLGDQLRPIGAKIAPHLNEGQADAWRMAMILALSDLPAWVSLRAARKAIHTPMKFLNEAETAIREIAAELVEQQRLALWNLKRQREEIERAANPQPALPAPDPDQPLTLEEVRAAPKQYRRLGLQLGYITEEMFNEAARLDLEEAEISGLFDPDQKGCYTEGDASDAPDETP